MYSLGLLVLCNVYYFWWNKTGASVLCLSLFLVLILSTAYQFKLNKKQLVLVIWALILFCYISMPGPKGIFTFPILNFLGIVLICIAPVVIFKEWMNIFFWIVALCCLPSIFIYFSLLASIEIPYSIYFPSSGERAWENQFYRIYPGSVFLEHLIYSVRGISLARLQGFFDEPGFLGTITSLYLVANRYSLTRLRNKIIFFLGLASLSLAFYFISFIYLVIKSILDKNFNVIIVLVAAISGLIFILTQFDISDIPLLSRLAFGLEEPGNINNRTGSGFESALQTFIDGNSSDILFGMGNAAHTQLQAGSSSIKALFYNYGVFGCFLIFGFYVIVFLRFLDRRSVKDSLVFVLIFFISAYQRPDILSPVYFSIFVYGLTQVRSFKPSMHL